MPYRTIIYFLSAIILVIYANCTTNPFTFDLTYSKYPDSISLYFLHSLNDASLLQNDPLSGFYQNSFNILSREFPFLLIYSALLKAFPLVLAVKILSIVLCLLTIVMVYRIGACLYSRNYAVVVSGIFLVYFLSMDTFYGGLPRCFGPLIICSFLYLLIKERYYWLPLFIPLALLFYPFISSVLTVMCILIILFYKSKIAYRTRYVGILIFSFAISFIYAQAFKSNMVADIPSNLTILGSYKYTQNVDFPINAYNPLHILQYFVFNLNEHSELYVYFTGAFLLTGVVIFVCRRANALQLPKPIWLILLASALSFLIIYPIHPISASRQFVFTLPLFFVFFVSWNVVKMAGARITPIIVVVPALLIFMVLHPRFNDIESYRKYKPCYDYIESLPKNALIAGYPDSALVKSVPFFSKRALFFNEEIYDISASFSELDELNQKKQSVVKAFYADSLLEIKSFIIHNKIDYLIVESSVYQPTFINMLGKSISIPEKVTHSLIKLKKNENQFALLEFAKKNYDRRVKLDEGEVYIIKSSKIHMALN